MAYTAAAGDVETGREERTVVLVEKKSIMRLACTVSGFLLFTALCIVGTRIFTWYSSSRLERMVQSGQTEALNKTDAAEKKDQHYSRISNKTKAAIHLTANQWKGEANDKLEWENDRGHAFIQGGFQLVNNQIVIPQTGLYFVYSRASFAVSCTRGKRSTHLIHKIWQHTDYYDSRITLMSGMRWACQHKEGSYRDGQGSVNAIYLGAVFQLNKGDRLGTETNHLSELQTDAVGTFFGVFAL